MYDNYNYPLGADIPSAPWNDVGQEERWFDVRVYSTMVKRTAVMTDDYILECEEDGSNSIFTYETDWEEVYKHSEYTLPELLKVLCDLARTQLASGGGRGATKWKNIIRSAEGWIEDELVVEEE